MAISSVNHKDAVMNKYLLMLLILSSGNVFAFTSKWIDEEGKVHYSDQLPPFHAKSKLILNTDMPEAPPTISGVSGVPATNKPTADIDAAKKAAADKAAQDAANKALKQANCIAAKQNLANLKDGMRIAVIDPNTGERSYLDDTQRAKNLDESQQQVGKFCQ
jgi:hypothetical protein